MMERAAWLTGIWLLGCASSPTPHPSSADGEAARQVSSSDAAEKSTKSESPHGATEITPGVGSEGKGPKPSATDETLASPAAGAKQGAVTIHDLCFAMCDKVKEKCPRSAFESCRVNCGKYESPAEGCKEVVAAALSCARDAADLVCANVAPESCAKQFRRISACAAGEKPAEAIESSGTKMPEGFAHYDNAALGVRAPMPAATTQGTEPNVIVVAKGPEGAVYSIRKLARPEGKLNEKVFLKLALNLFGRCSDKMKMQGMVDKPGRSSINYTMKCPNGDEESGLFWATDRALFIASIRGVPSKEGAEAFLYGFEAR